jgi:hypothetical protein
VADRTIEAQKAVVAALKAAAPVTALVSTRIHDRAPDGVRFPHVEIGTVASIPFDGQALRGMDALMQIDVWSRRTGAVQCRQIMAAIKNALHFQPLTLDAGALVMMRVSALRDMRDPDGVTVHGVIDLQILTDG